MLIVDGGLPYVDFLTFYGPGQYYLTAALFWVFGENLLFLRLLHVASLAALALAVGSTAWQITRSEAAARWSSVTAVAVMLYAMPNAGYPAVLATLLLLTTVTVLESWERRGERWRLAAASSLAGLSGIFRWDFALYGLAALVLAVMIKVVGERDKRRAGASLGAALGPALGILFIVYLPLIWVTVGPSQWYREVLEFSLFEFPQWRAFESIRPGYWQILWGLEHGRPDIFVRAGFRLAYFVVPSLAVVAALAAVASSTRFAHPPVNYLLIVCLLLGLQLRVRTELWQALPFVLATIPLGAFTVGRSRRRLGASLATAAAVALVGLAVAAACVRMTHHFRGPLVELDAARATWIRIDAGDAAYVELVRLVRQATKPGDRLYSGALDHSRFVKTDVLLYFLADRHPADRFVELVPGLANTAAAQREIIHRLDAHSPPVAVLLAEHPLEPNLTAYSNGIRLLDRYLADHYPPLAEIAGYRVLSRRGSLGAPTPPLSDSSPAATR
jgi:hypothetical protein